MLACSNMRGGVKTKVTKSLHASVNSCNLELIQSESVQEKAIMNIGNKICEQDIIKSSRVNYQSMTCLSDCNKIFEQITSFDHAIQISKQNDDK